MFSNNNWYKVGIRLEGNVPGCKETISIYFEMLQSGLLCLLMKLWDLFFITSIEFSKVDH